LTLALTERAKRDGKRNAKVSVSSGVDRSALKKFYRLRESRAYRNRATNFIDEFRRARSAECGAGATKSRTIASASASDG